MTIPSERTRALRWRGEFLNELRVVDSPIIQGQPKLSPVLDLLCSRSGKQCSHLVGDLK